MDRYKQLLLKQRDIMIALTQRLVERDEQIMSLQDELDAYVSIFLPQYTYILTCHYQFILRRSSANTTTVSPVTHVLYFHAVLRIATIKNWRKSWTRKPLCSSSSRGFQWK